MTRTKKNILTVVIIIALLGLNLLTMHSASQQMGQTVATRYYFFFFIENALLFLTLIIWTRTDYHQKKIKKVFSNNDKRIILVLLIILLAENITLLEISMSKHLPSTLTIAQQGSTTAKGSLTITSKQTLTNNYKTRKKDESVILVKKEGVITLKNSTINKKGGQSSSLANSEFLGINAGILVQANGEAIIENSKIITSAKGSNALFATGENSKILVTNSIIETNEESSRGIDATYGGSIKAESVIISTNESSSPAVCTDKKDATLEGDYLTLETHEELSPLLYSNGTLSIKNSKGSSHQSGIMTLEGDSNVTITDCTLEASGRGSRNEQDQSAIKIYQAENRKITDELATLNITTSNLSILENSTYYRTAPLFFITNTSATINLTNTRFYYGSNLLMRIKGTKEWGKANENGANVILNANNQVLNGNIEIDNLSSLTLQLSNKSSYKGVINRENTANEVHIKLDKTSTIALTDTTYITSLENEDPTNSNINFNGYTLYIKEK